MKRFANYILTSVFLLAAGAGIKTQAQNDADLLRFSMTNPIGTSRFNAMGGAFGALGANFSSLSTNPAGIGLYTRHEISLT
ncbi:MAG: transporter, partial [Bacteroidales bacterium]|nr:transporter [Bacteroidales bacterium]